MPPALVVRDLYKSYRAGFGRCWARVHVLAGVSFTLAEGERLAIVGPAACGKTTLLHCVAGLRQIDSGEVRWSSPDTADRARAVCVAPPDAVSVPGEPLLIDLSETRHSIVEWAECLNSRDLAAGGWVLTARRLGPIAHLCDTVLLFADGRLHARGSVRRVAEPRIPDR
jgi:ATPase components of various ABC-type transport systems, contain duplicated ATPase